MYVEPSSFGVPNCAEMLPRPRKALDLLINLRSLTIDFSTAVQKLVGGLNK